MNTLKNLDDFNNDILSLADEYNRAEVANDLNTTIEQVPVWRGVDKAYASSRVCHE